MSKQSSRPGFRLGTKLLLAGSVLLVIPWLGLQSLRAMQDFLIQGQAQAQLLTARGIATLLQGRDDLFEDRPDSAEGYDRLPLYPLKSNILLDGFDEDWGNRIGLARQYGEGEPSFSLVLAEDASSLYGLLKVRDSTPLTRHPGYLRMDHADHVRLYLKTRDNEDARLLLSFEGSGRITAYPMDGDWRYASPGTPDYRIRGYVDHDPTGYTIEFRMPLSMLGPARQLGLAVADVRDPDARGIAKVAGTFPTVDAGVYNLVVLRSPQTESIIEGLQGTDSRLWIVDRDLNVRATRGKIEQTNVDGPPGTENPPIWRALLSRLTDALADTGGGPFADFDPALTMSRDDPVLREALAGGPGTARRRSLDNRGEIITAAYPIQGDDGILGAVMLEQSTGAVLRLQRESLERVTALTLASLGAVILTLLAFAARLAWRVRRLDLDADAAIDRFGRLQHLGGIRGTDAADEIGDLARNIERMLNRLRRHQQFLTGIPRTLRHEINNPLNTIGTSLENLALALDNGEQRATPENNAYLLSARRGLARIGHLVEQLSEAASLEQALGSDEMEMFDLASMVRTYTENQQKQHPHPLVVTIEPGQVPILGSDIHLEQLLDKLLDNARDFSRDDAPIEIRLRRDRQQLELSVTNRGPLIPREQRESLFQLMSSRRPGDSGNSGHHIGLGLYIARIIAEHHGGEIGAENLADGSGVCFRVRLPIAGKPPRGGD